MLRFIWTYTVTFFYILTLKRKLGPDFFKNAEQGIRVADMAIEAAGYTVKIIGDENIPSENGVLYISNHQSFFDIFASIHILRKQLGFIAKAQLRNFFYVGHYVEKMGGVLIDRDDVRSQVEVISQLTKILKSGYNVFIFPEGTRSRDGKLAEFKSGSFRTALKSRCRIVPLTFFNNHEVAANTGDTVIKVKIDPPVTADIYEKMNTSEISEYVKNIIENNLKNGFDEKSSKIFQRPAL